MPRGKSSAERKLILHREQADRVRRRLTVLQAQGRKAAPEATLTIVREENDLLLIDLLNGLGMLKPAKPLDARTIRYISSVIEERISDRTERPRR